MEQKKRMTAKQILSILNDESESAEAQNVGYVSTIYKRYNEGYTQALKNVLAKIRKK